MNWLLIPLLLALVVVGTACNAQPAVFDIAADYHDGQVFLTWNETPGLEGTLVVRMSDQPITAANIGQATIVAQGLNPGSAYDWWLNPETYGNPVAVDPATGQKPPFPHEGFVIKPGGAKLGVDSGLHVHTVAAEEAGTRYYAVTTKDAAGVENLEVAAGRNSLAQPVNQQAAAPQPVWQGNGTPDVAAGKGLPLHLVLHAKTGRMMTNYLAFGDKTLGWREGLPFKFGVEVKGGAVIVTPIDRTWIGRMFPEGKDSCQLLTPAIHSFWYGYNSNINDPAKMAEGVATNYTERRLLWLLDWVKKTYQTDPNRSYCTGSSMGGCGTISFGFRHPELFAACTAQVPIVAYDKGKGGDSAMRVAAECGSMDTLTSDGLPLKERLDGTLFVRNHKGDLPFLVIINGRKDTSIPWWKCPDFYRTLRDQRQGFVAAWDDGDHAKATGLAPEDARQLSNLSNLHGYALNKSFLAFSNSSQDNNPGNGDAADGDIEGTMNRGLSFGEPVEAPGKYEALVKWTLAPEKLPMTVDVTPRRLQAFKLKAGDRVTAVNLDEAGKEVQRETLVADEAGLVTFGGFKVTGVGGNRMVLGR